MADVNTAADADDNQNDELDDDELVDEPESGEVDNRLKALRTERKKNRELQAQIWELKNGRSDSATSGKEANVDELRKTVRMELAQEFGLELAREKAVNVLTELGYRGNPERGAKILDLASTVVEGKVDASALRDAVEEWKEDEPQLFKRTRRAADEDEVDDDTPKARRQVGSADIGKKAPVTKAKSAAEILAEKRFGKK